MKFNHFRILVTILASFGAFFAYVCRLNLSLSIEHMTIRHSKPSTPRPPLDTLQQSQPHNESQATRRLPAGGFGDPHLVYKLPPIYNEEHSYARISKSQKVMSLYGPKAALLKKVDLQARDKSILIPGPEADSNVLSFDVDAGPAMNSKNSSSTGATSGDNEQQPDNDGPKIEPANSNLLDWKDEEKNDLLAAFFWGYVFLQIPSARAAEIFGAKFLLLMCGIGTGLCSLVFPFAAKFFTSIWPAKIVRMIMGASQGALFPVCYVVLCEWLTKNERSSWLPVPAAFSRIGTIAMNLFLPIIIKTYDWETVFYISGAVTLIWCVVFLVFGSNSPAQSYWISREELIYIESHLEPRTGNLNKQSDMSASNFTINEPSSATAAPACGQLPSGRPQLSKPSIDWMKIITNRPILILSLVMFMSDWCNFILLVKLPGFLEPVLGMDLVEVGFWSSVLVAIFFVMYPLAGFCASKVEQHFDSLSSLHVRTLFETIAHLLQAAGCLLIAFSDNRTLVIVALCMMMVGRATVGGGQCLMPPELSKEYPGTVFAFCNTLANFSGIIGPKVVTWMVDEPCKHECWFGFFLLSAIMFATSGVAFCLLADNQPQDFAKMKKSLSKNKPTSVSQAQLTDVLSDNRKQQQVSEMFQMEAFSRVMNEPSGAKEERQI